jgi:hypothetical protein
MIGLRNWVQPAEYWAVAQIFFEKRPAHLYNALEA